MQKIFHDIVVHMRPVGNTLWKDYQSELFGKIQKRLIDLINHCTTQGGAHTVNTMSVHADCLDSVEQAFRGCSKCGRT